MDDNLTNQDQLVEGADDLNRAVEGQGEGDNTPAPEDEATRRDNIERSQLGRKVANLARMNEETQQTLKQLTENINSLVSGMGKGRDEPFTIPTTKEEMERMFADFQNRQAEYHRKYESGYVSAFDKLLDTESDERLRKQVEDEMLKNFNVKYSDDPARDAEVNFSKALASVLRKSTASAKPQANVKGQQPQAVNNGSGNNNNKTKLPELSPEAMDFIKMTGMSADSVQKALSREAPGITGGGFK